MNHELRTLSMEGVDIADSGEPAACATSIGGSCGGASCGGGNCVGASIADTVKRFWSLPEGFDPAKTHSEQKPWFDERRLKYPGELMQEFDALQQACTERGSCLQTFDFLYRNRLYNGFLPHMTHLTGAGFAALCPQVARRPHSTIADLGSGDGRVALGLALHLPGIERIYAIDVLPSAHERMAEYVSQLSPAERSRLDGRIIPVLGDYRDPAFRERHGRDHGQADIALGAFPYIYDEFITSAAAFGRTAIAVVHVPRIYAAGQMESELASWDDVLDLRTRMLEMVQLPRDRVIISESIVRGEAPAAVPSWLSGQVPVPDPKRYP